MAWYAAHTIMYIKFKDDIQDKYPLAQPGNGTEITYLEMEVDSEESFAKLLKEEPVKVLYE